MKRLLAVTMAAAALLMLGPNGAIADVCACGQQGYWSSWWHDADGNPDTYGGHWDCAWIAVGGGGGNVIHGC